MPAARRFPASFLTKSPLSIEVILSNTLFFSFLIGFSASDLKAQSETLSRAERFKKQHDWKAPLGVPLLLSGNFGELRGNHFHTGVDLKTMGREGLPVLAATEGRVSRVKMSPWGYGNALYLEGPDDVLTVYAHLQAFVPDIQGWAVNQAYKGRTLGLDAAPSGQDAFWVEAGDTLGWSGNSGGSGGPHLHFEIRDANTQHPLNPLMGWLDKADGIPPSLPVLWLETGDHLRAWPIPTTDTVRVDGMFRASVEAFDRLDGASNICGVLSLEATLTGADGTSIWSHGFALKELDFGVNKDMNAHAFYPVWSGQRKQVHRLHRLSGNRLAIYGPDSNEGWTTLAKGECARLICRVEDAAGNVTEREMILQGGSGLDGWEQKSIAVGPGTILEKVTEEPGQWSQDGVELSWEVQTFFEEAQLSWTPDIGALRFAMGPEEKAWRKPVHVQWAFPEPSGVWSKTGAMFPSEPLAMDRWVAVQMRGDAIAKTVVAEVKDLAWHMEIQGGGQWEMRRDTLSPKVLPFYSGTPLVRGGDAVWYIDDDLSGIESVELTFDGHWVRSVWDPKRNMITYQASDGRHVPGQVHDVALVVEDAVGNVQEWRRPIMWPGGH